MVVDDAQDLRLLDARDGLGQLVVVHQYHLLAARPQQVIAGQGAHHLLLRVQHGVAAVAALQHHLADIVDIVVHVERDQVVRGAGAADGRSLIDQAVDAAGIQRRGDDAGLPRVLQPLRLHIGLAQNQAVHLSIQSTADHVRLAAAEDDAVRAVEQQVLTVLGQGDGHGAADAVHQLAAVAHNAALDDAEQVEKGDLLHLRVTHGVQAEGGDIAGGQHTIECTVLIDHGDGGYLLVPHQLPGAVHGDGGVQAGRAVEIQILHLSADILDAAGRLEMEPLQHTVGLIADGPQMHRHVLLLAQCVFQGGIGHGGHDGVRVRIAVSGNIDLVHA